MGLETNFREWVEKSISTDKIEWVDLTKVFAEQRKKKAKFRRMAEHFWEQCMWYRIREPEKLNIKWYKRKIKTN